jgi:hypothetical protein
MARPTAQNAATAHRTLVARLRPGEAELASFDRDLEELVILDLQLNFFDRSAHQLGARNG